MNRRELFKLLLAGAAVAAAPSILLKAAKPKLQYVDVTFSTADYSMCLDDFEARILEPAIAKLAKQMDAYCLESLSRAA